MIEQLNKSLSDHCDAPWFLPEVAAAQIPVVARNQVCTAMEQGDCVGSEDNTTNETQTKTTQTDVKHELNEAVALKRHVKHEQHAPQDFHFLRAYVFSRSKWLFKMGRAFTCKIRNLKSMYLRSEIDFFVLCVYKRNEN